MSEISVNYKKRLLSIDGVSFFCIFGKNGVTKNKIEGDWKTPVGTFKIGKIFYRKDKVGEIKTKIESIEIKPNYAWCDDPNKKEYNKMIKIPFEGSYENLWRDDEMYDILIVIEYNTNPIIKNKGSAIFIHIAKKEMKHTRGCLAIKREDMFFLIKKIDKNCIVSISN